MNLHLSLKYSGLNRQITASEKRNKKFVKFAGKIRRRSVVESRAASLPAVSVQRELRNHEQPSAPLHKSAIHSAKLVVKYSQFDNFVGNILRLFLPIPPSDSHE